MGFISHLITRGGPHCSLCFPHLLSLVNQVTYLGGPCGRWRQERCSAGQPCNGGKPKFFQDSGDSCFSLGLLVLNIGNEGVIHNNHEWKSQQPPATHPFPAWNAPVSILGFPSMVVPQKYGWFFCGKIPSFEMDDDWEVSLWLWKRPYGGFLKWGYPCSSS